MNYNLKVEMERRNGVVISQIEVSGVGRAGRKVFNAPTFKAALAQLQKEHDTLLGHVEAYHKPAVETRAAPAQAPAPAKAKAEKKATPRRKDAAEA